MKWCLRSSSILSDSSMRCAALRTTAGARDVSRSTALMTASSSSRFSCNKAASADERVATLAHRWRRCCCSSSSCCAWHATEMKPVDWCDSDSGTTRIDAGARGVSLAKFLLRLLDATAAAAAAAAAAADVDDGEDGEAIVVSEAKEIAPPVAVVVVDVDGGGVPVTGIV